MVGIDDPGSTVLYESPLLVKHPSNDFGGLVANPWWFQSSIRASPTYRPGHFCYGSNTWVTLSYRQGPNPTADSTTVTPPTFPVASRGTDDASTDTPRLV